MTLDEYKKNVNLLNEWARAYYVHDNPIASDYEYDKLYEAVRNYEKQNPQKILDFSPTQRVGDVLLDGFNKQAHHERMYSLDDVFTQNELKGWIGRASKKTTNLEFFCEPKFDGASLNLIYENGRLQKAITRGNGLIGEDITNNARTISTIALKIPYEGLLEIRGEVLIGKENFEHLNTQRMQNGLDLFANARNAASGSLRQLDPKIVASRGLIFVVWAMGMNSLALQSHSEQMDFISSQGFKRLIDGKKCLNEAQIMSFYQELVSKRDSIDVLLDGMVIKLNDINTQTTLGFTQKSPRWAVAFKFEPTQKTTRIKGVELSVGRMGTITPVAIVEPTQIDGATIERASLHNFEEITRKDLRINDKVFIIRSGDVIPKIVSSIKSSRDGTQKIIPTPNACPVCGSEVFKEGAFLRCENINCPAKAIHAIIHFASKSCMNIDGLGEQIIRLLYEKNLIKNIKDLFFLKAQSLLDLEGFKQKKAQNIIEAIEKSKDTSCERFLFALGIEHIGIVASKEVCKRFHTNFLDLTKQDLLNIDGFGEEMSASFVDFVRVNKQTIKDLLALVRVQKKQELKGEKLLGKSVVITGTLSNPRQFYKDLLEQNGAKISSSVSSKTSFVLCGQNAGSKKQKAKELGIQIITQEELEKMLD